jgi:hypothetical protein
VDPTRRKPRGKCGRESKLSF